MTTPVIRQANKTDLPDLIALEKRCFETDLLSRRSFQNFIKPGPHELLVLLADGRLIGYVLVLYRSGTNLARLYSIALSPDSQGKGYSHQLITSAEDAAAKNHCVYMRLEVSIDNKVAQNLYEKHGYQVIGQIAEYYDDGKDALRMEKRLHSPATNVIRPKPYYQQTTEFTCGPASLMMAIKTLKTDYEMTRHEELQIWREATTIFMTSGHGGCSPHGLALSAWHRGLSVSLHINRDDAPFLDSVRDEEKKAVIELVHQDFLEQIQQSDIEIFTHELEADELDSILQNGYPVLALISTWRLNRNKAPHWVYVADSDDQFVYINDPDLSDDPHYSQTDFIQTPIDKVMFRNMARFGRKKLRALLVITDKH